MSAYKRIATKYKNLESLKKALVEVLGESGFMVAKNPQESTLPMFGFHGELRPEKCSISIPRASVNKFSTGMSNDLGFYWDAETKTYGLIVSDYDRGSRGTTKLLNSTKQLYTYYELSRQAKLKGYKVSKETDSSGVIRMKLGKF